MVAVVTAAIAVSSSLWRQTKAGKESVLLTPLVQTVAEPRTVQLKDGVPKAMQTKVVPKVSEPKDVAPEPVPPPPPPAFRIPILMYHYVGGNPNSNDTTRNSLTVPLKNFEEQLRYLSQSGFTTLSLNDLADIATKKIACTAKPIVLTFDDGYIDFYVNAFPVLKKYNLRAVVFIPTGLINQGYYMSWDQIREISDSGLVSFEAHTVTHRYLTGLGRGEIIAELRNSKETLESETNQKVSFIAYPFGAVNDVVYNAARSVGFIGGVGTWSGIATNLNMNMPRLRMGSYVTLDFFASLL